MTRRTYWNATLSLLPRPTGMQAAAPTPLTEACCMGTLNVEGDSWTHVCCVFVCLCVCVCVCVCVYCICFSPRNSFIQEKVHRLQNSSPPVFRFWSPLDLLWFPLDWSPLDLLWSPLDWSLLNLVWSPLGWSPLDLLWAGLLWTSSGLPWFWSPLDLLLFGSLFLFLDPHLH